MIDYSKYVNSFKDSAPYDFLFGVIDDLINISSTLEELSSHFYKLSDVFNKNNLIGDFPNVTLHYHGIYKNEIILMLTNNKTCLFYEVKKSLSEIRSIQRGRKIDILFD